MAVKQKLSVEVPGSVAAGAGFDCSHWEKFTVYVDALVGTWKLEVQGPDSTGWYAVGSPVTNAGYLDCTVQAQKARINVTAYTSGSPVGNVIGMYASTGG